MKAIYKKLVQSEQVAIYELEEQNEVPPVQEDSVLVKIKACGITPTNNKILSELSKKRSILKYPAGQSIAGEVVQVGSSITTLQQGDQVAGIIPIDSGQTGCGEYCTLQEYELVKIPDTAGPLEVAASLMDGIKAVSGLHYLARLCGGDTILIMDGAKTGLIMVQLALHWGAKVLTTVSLEEDKAYLEKNYPSIAQIIVLETKNNLLVCSVMEETGGLGVDCFLDFGVNMYTDQDSNKCAEDYYDHLLPSKHDIITCLAVGGRWVTSQPNLQLDPPNCQLLFLKSASVCFLFEQMWILSHSQLGRYQHILREVVEKLSKHIIKPCIKKVLSFQETLEVLKKNPGPGYVIQM